MATNTSSAGETLLLNFDGKLHNLIVRVRSDNTGLSVAKLSELVGATIGAWMRAYRSVQIDDPEIYLDKTACEKVGIEPSSSEPYVTVFNKSYDALSLTVHSNDNGGGAVKCAKAYYDAIKTLQDKAPQYFSDSGVMPTSKTEAEQVKTQLEPEPDTKVTTPDFTPAPSQSTASVSALPTKGNPFIRSTKDVNLPGVLAIEGGKPDSPNFNTMARIADKPYDWKEKQYVDGALVAYPITGPVSVGQYNEQLQIIIPTEHNRTIKIMNRGGDHDYEWKTIRDKLSLDEEKLSPGQRSFIPAAYVVLKISDSGENQYKNFYGFYTAPEAEQQTA